VFEGQFKSTESGSCLDGWSRAVYKNGDYMIAWRKDGMLHGYCVKVSSNGEILEEGLYDKDEFKQDETNLSFHPSELFALKFDQDKYRLEAKKVQEFVSDSNNEVVDFIHNFMSTDPVGNDLCKPT
jgi:hypothetical protein